MFVLSFFVTLTNMNLANFNCIRYIDVTSFIFGTIAFLFVKKS